MRATKREVKQSRTERRFAPLEFRADLPGEFEARLKTYDESRAGYRDR